MTKVQKGVSFIEEIVALIQGDNAEAKAQKIKRQADSALKTQIATLTGDTIVLEDKLEEAKENLRLARLNYGEEIKEIEKRTQYVQNLIKAKNAVTEAQENLNTHLETLDFITKELASLE